MAIPQPGVITAVQRQVEDEVDPAAKAEAPTQSLAPASLEFMREGRAWPAGAGDFIIRKGLEHLLKPKNPGVAEELLRQGSKEAGWAEELLRRGSKEAGSAMKLRSLDELNQAARAGDANAIADLGRRVSDYHAESWKAGELLLEIAKTQPAAIKAIENAVAAPLGTGPAQAGMSSRSYRKYFLEMALRLHPGKHNDLLKAARTSGDPEVQRIANEVAVSP